MSVPQQQTRNNFNSVWRDFDTLLRFLLLLIDSLVKFRWSC